MERFPKKIFQNLIERGFEEAIFNKFKNIEAFYITKKQNWLFSIIKERYLWYNSKKRQG